MKIAVALDEAELAQLLLGLVPQAQQDQYQMIKGTIPVNLRATHNTLVTIEKNGLSSSQETQEIGKETCKPKGKEESLF